MEERRVMTKKLARLGNSSAVILDKPLMEILGLRPGDRVTVVTDGISLIITPEFRRPTRKEADAAFKKTIQRHGEALRALGDTSEISYRRPTSTELSGAIDFALKKYGRALDRLGDSRAQRRRRR